MESKDILERQSGILCREAPSACSSKEELFGRYAGKYILEKLVIGGNDLSEAYVKGWRDRSLYMLFEITPGGKCFLKAHSATAEKKYEYYFDPCSMRYHLKEDMSDEGTHIMIEDGLLTEDASDHLMAYRLTGEEE